MSTEEAQQPRIEELPDSPEAESAPETQEIPNDDSTIPEGSSIAIHSRNAKKAMQAVQKLGLKKVDGILRLVMRRSRTILFTISRPEVYQTPAGGYIVFGEIRVEDLGAPNMQNMQAAAAAAAAQQGAGEGGAPDVLADAAEGLKIQEEPEEEGEIDETGLSGEDIETVMGQANCSRAKAVKALKSNDGDIVSAIMECTA
ncbi:hypothetical protein CANCADRAFT_28061 [Tortispora caseinolytica NRRL Y-17796]|uniref:Nascent polypeptide-associated complex subunit alpha n=1 Tax=Tortispora caseinolytica NRRL Y-17796 TaxID=767744 RepID=A0A1E4TBQ1_9ASCO|nr:hypothetical protein CANCADRAFT_28061 [Tortispora caseinolytica NRRL Y-17796]